MGEGSKVGRGNSLWRRLAKGWNALSVSLDPFWRLNDDVKAMGCFKDSMFSLGRRREERIWLDLAGDKLGIESRCDCSDLSKGWDDASPLLL